MHLVWIKESERQREREREEKDRRKKYQLKYKFVNERIIDSIQMSIYQSH